MKEAKQLHEALASVVYERFPGGPFDCQSLVIATDGRFIIAVPASAVDGPVTPAPKEVAALVGKWDAASKALTRSVTAAQLLAFVEPARVKADCATCAGKHVVTCDKCDGDGHTECECRCGDVHDADCEGCDGDGTYDCPDCTPNKNSARAKFLHAVVDRSLLLKLLSVVEPQQDEVIEVSKLSMSDAWGFVGNGWKAALMPMAASFTASVDFDDEATWKTEAA